MLRLKHARGPSTAARTNLGSFRLGYYKVWEVATWEFSLGELPLGKMPLGKSNILTLCQQSLEFP